MARRVVQECDLTKQEYDPDQTVTITFKKKGKDKGRSYDLSPEAAAKLEQQLVAGSKLPLDWGFVAATATRATRPPGKQTLADLDDDSETQRTIAEKKAELRAEGVIPPEDQTPAAPEEPAVSEVVEVEGGRKDCLHMNKGRIQTTLRGGKRFIFRQCQECRARIPEMSTTTRAAYLSGKVNKSDDVNIRELS